MKRYSPKWFAILIFTLLSAGLTFAQSSPFHLPIDGNEKPSNIKKIISKIAVPPLGYAPKNNSVACTPDLYDGFESRSYTPTWSNGRSTVFSVENTNSAQGTNHLQGLGGNDHFSGLSTTIANSTPNEISWYINPQGGGSGTGSNNVVIGDNIPNILVLSSFLNGSSIGFSSLNQGSFLLFEAPVSAAGWYFIRLKNINYITKTYDIYINNTLQYKAFPFYQTGVNDVSKIYLYNYSSGSAAKWDDIFIGKRPAEPIITPPLSLSVCSPSTLTLTASGCAGTVTWSQGSATGSSLTLSAVGTYSITATCTVNGCISDQSTAVTGLEIKAKPNVPNINAPTEKVVCFPTTLTLTASPCAGTVTWSQGAATGTSLTISAVGTYSINATCTVNGCTSDASSSVDGLEIKALPIITTSNTGPYTVGQTINLNGTGIGTYNWTGPNNFTNTLSNPNINNALSVNAGVYILSVTGLNACIATSTTNVVVNEIDPCDPTRIVDYLYVKAGNPNQPLFQLTNGMIINQIRDQLSILVNPVCSSVTIESMEMNIQGPELNWNILQNVPPNALFDNYGFDVWGRNFNPGNYTLTVTGYARDNKGGGITYGPKIMRFTVVGNLATINAPTLSKTSICAGSSVDVTFAKSGTFNGDNQFQVELSDSSGGFAKPLLIGTTNATGTITCLIPQNTLQGTKYLIRVTSSNQVVVSNPVISQVTVNPLNYSLLNPTNNLTGTSTKKAVNSINASNKIISPANVIYQAGKSIVLIPGFETSAVFRAEVKSCDN